MTFTSGSRVRLLLGIATMILLLICTAAAWALPGPIVGAHPTPRAAASAPAAPCDLIPGSARDYCLEHAAGTPAPPDAASTGTGTGPGEGAPWRPWLLLFSTIAIAAAIGLAGTAGRRPR